MSSTGRSIASGATPKFKLWVSSGTAEGVFGDGKWRLLKAIEGEGSLSGAAKALGISYRKAWGDLRKAEECLDAALIDKSRGGRSGGGTDLTETGKRWLAAYSRFRADVEEAVARAYHEHIAAVL